MWGLAGSLAYHKGQFSITAHAQFMHCATMDAVRAVLSAGLMLTVAHYAAVLPDGSRESFVSSKQLTGPPCLAQQATHSQHVESLLRSALLCTYVCTYIRRGAPDTGRPRNYCKDPSDLSAGPSNNAIRRLCTLPLRAGLMA
jgi:hypothetical protein